MQKQYPQSSTCDIPTRIRHRQFATRPSTTTLSPPSTIKAQNLTRPSIAHIKLAFQDTPEKLRVLEDGWRERRRIVSKDPTSLIGHDRLRGIKVGVTGTEAKVVEHRHPTSKHNRPKSGPSVNEAATSSRGFLPTKTSAKTRKIRIDAPPTPPPSPPPSRDLNPKLSIHPNRSQRALNEVVQVDSGEPTVSEFSSTLSKLQPILAHPLIPTSQPIPLTRRNSDSTIHIHPLSSPYELTIQLSRSSPPITVYRGGSAIEHGSKRKRVELTMVAQWKSEDKRIWDKVQKLVEGFKRITARIKVYHTLGRLVMTCSTPPDIILSFAVDCSSTTPVRTTNHQDMHKPQLRPHSKTTKVQVTYMRIENQLRIDTSSRPTDRLQLPAEAFRSRRTVNMRSLIGPKCDSRNGEQLCVLLHGHSSGWREEEREGLRRLCELRSEWARYDCS